MSAEGARARVAAHVAAGFALAAVLVTVAGCMDARERVPSNGCVRASSFGWNPTNATAALQAAIDSGVSKLYSE